MTLQTEIPYAELVRSDRVHGTLYTEPRIFEEELERIWTEGWVAVGHVSEIPEPGDYRTKWLGRNPVIMSRSKTGEVNLIFNRCSHRGAQICDEPRGNSNVFRCPYHGWTFANSGELLGAPYQSGYGDGLDKSTMGVQVISVGTYRGFVFGRLAPEGPTLEEHLGNAAEAIDRFVDFSPLGELELTAGWIRHNMRANWKVLLENETDGYHPGFVHGSIFSVVPTGLADIFADKSVAEVRDLGGGHTELDLRPEYHRLGTRLQWLGTSEEKLADYVQALATARGEEQAGHMLEAGPPHVMVFPNLFLAELSVHLFQPVAVDRTIQHQTIARFAGAPSLNRRVIRKAEATIGPAGLLQADDSEMYERVQRGLGAHDPEWVILKRGLHRERLDPNGMQVSNSTDETSLRAIWRHYLETMDASSEVVA